RARCTRPRPPHPTSHPTVDRFEAEPPTPKENTMSTTRSTETNKVRNRIFIALGAIIVVATYVYLVIAQPTDIADSATNQSSLIAMAGYVIGAILLAAGSIHRLP